MPFDIAAMAATIFSDTAKKARAGTLLEVLVSALALTTLAACVKATRPSSVIASTIQFLGFGITGSPGSVHDWFTDPIRATTITWGLAGAALLAFGTAVFVVARLDVRFKSAHENVRNAEKAVQETDRIILFALNRVDRCAVTWVVALCLLAEVHGRPSGLYGWAWPFAVVGLVFVVQLLFGLNNSPSGFVSDVASNLRLQLLHAGGLIMAVPVRVFLMATRKPWRAETGPHDF